MSKHIVRVQHDKQNPYTIINKKSIWDEKLSLEAVGLLARLISRPDDWRVDIRELQKSCRCGRDKILRILNELQEAGYAFRYQPICAKGKFGNLETLIFETPKTPEEIQKMFPQPDFPYTDFQGAVLPRGRPRALLNTNVTKERKNKKDIVCRDPEKTCAPPPDLPPKTPEKTLPLRTQNSKTMVDSLSKRWRLKGIEKDSLKLLLESGINTDEGTMVHWAKTYTPANINSAIIEAKQSNASNLGGYVQTLLKKNIAINHDYVEKNREVATFFSENVSRKIVPKKAYCVILLESGSTIDLSYSMDPEAFYRKLSEV